MVGQSGAGHLADSLSAADLITALFFSKMNIRPTEPKWEDRDRFILSKWYAIPVLYAALANRGFFPKEELNTLQQLNTRLQGQPDYMRCPGLDCSSGSLGQGLSIANGMALARRLNHRNYHIYILMGCLEMVKGQFWESVMTAAKYKLDSITLILDYNETQIPGINEGKGNNQPLVEKFRSYKWNVFEVDGHFLKDIFFVLDEARAFHNQPSVIIANTIKGKGVSYMEKQQDDWHYKVPDADEIEKALRELV